MNIDDKVREISQQVKRHVDSCDSDIPNMPLSDMVLFIGLKYIYVAMKSQMTTPEEASLAKKKLVVAYQAAEYDRELYQQETRKRNRIASELVELEKCGCEHCRRLIRIFDGRSERKGGSK